MSLFVPHQCTERESGGWEDCTWCSGVMLNNAAHAANVRPSTRAEYEALRVAGGDGPAEKPGDGSNLAQLVAGIKRRYGWTPVRVGPPGLPRVSFATVMSHLKPGYCAVLQGGMTAWTRSSHWNRWDPFFRGSHSVFVERRDSTARLWWMNPLAPNSYAGEWIPLSEAARFYNAFTGGAIFARVGQLVALVLRYGGIRLSPRQVKRVDVASGRKAVVRSRPTRDASQVATIPDGGTFTAYQVTKTGQLLAGSRVWYGSILGTRWVHSSAF